MILSCPSCSAQYFADDKAIGENGRTVRCAACGHAWFARPELSLEERFNASDLSREKVERMRQATKSSLQPHQAIREKEFARKAKGAKFAALSAWGMSAVLFLAFGAFAVTQRDMVVKLWPKASSAYAMAGLDTNRFGLEFGPVSAERTFDGTMPVLSIAGTVDNITNRDQRVPVIKVELRDDHGATVDSVLISLDMDILPAGEEGHFETTLDSPPLEAFDLAMSFVQADEIGARLVEPSAEGADHHPADDHGSDDGHGPADDHAPIDDHGSDDAHGPDEEHPPASDPHATDDPHEVDDSHGTDDTHPEDH